MFVSWLQFVKISGFLPKRRWKTEPFVISPLPFHMYQGLEVEYVINCDTEGLFSITAQHVIVTANRSEPVCSSSRIDLIVQRQGRILPFGIPNEHLINHLYSSFFRVSFTVKCLAVPGRHARTHQRSHSCNNYR